MKPSASTNQPQYLIDSIVSSITQSLIFFLSFFCSIFPCSPFAFLSPSTCLFCCLFLSVLFFFPSEVYLKANINQPTSMLNKQYCFIYYSELNFLSFFLFHCSPFAFLSPSTCLYCCLFLSVLFFPF